MLASPLTVVLTTLTLIPALTRILARTLATVFIHFTPASPPRHLGRCAERATEHSLVDRDDLERVAHQREVLREARQPRPSRATGELVPHYIPHDGWLTEVPSTEPMSLIPIPVLFPVLIPILILIPIPILTRVAQRVPFAPRPPDLVTRDSLPPRHPAHPHPHLYPNPYRRTGRPSFSSPNALPLHSYQR